MASVAGFVLGAMGQAGSELSIAFVSDRKITELNRVYLSRNHPTDVMAFSQREGEGGTIQPHVLGDVIISVETAATQAQERGTSLEAELDLLLVHGILHLLGYEHTLGRNEARRMIRQQKRLMKEVQERFPSSRKKLK
jgi:probable rRNA maturation factor